MLRLHNQILTALKMRIATPRRRGLGPFLFDTRFG